MLVAKKLKRVDRFAKEIGLIDALSFAVAWTIRTPRVRVKVPGFPTSFTLRRFSSDLRVFEAVCLDREFDIGLAPDIGLIIDGGANIGISSAYFALKYKKAKIIAIEPDRENFELMRKNCREFDNIDFVLGGLWSHKTTLRIANPKAEKWAHSCEPAAGDSAEAFDAYTVDEIIDRSGSARCDLLKLDIEGGEDELFTNNTGWLERVDRILVEIHNPEGFSILKSACPNDEWAYTKEGEKIFLTRRRLADKARATH